MRVRTGDIDSRCVNSQPVFLSHRRAGCDSAHPTLPPIIHTPTPSLPPVRYQRTLAYTTVLLTSETHTRRLRLHLSTNHPTNQPQRPCSSLALAVYTLSPPFPQPATACRRRCVGAPASCWRVSAETCSGYVYVVARLAGMGTRLPWWDMCVCARGCGVDAMDLSLPQDSRGLI
jgi:hypothetical protein